ncbi:MAG TPA: hypothetical protein VN700_03685 [Vicinamibacterales bacterium]|nr:hypothetical protein [Vicinamibacterales bacterium]
MRAIRNITFVLFAVSWYLAGGTPTQAMSELPACIYGCEPTFQECCDVSGSQQEDYTTCDTYCNGCNSVGAHYLGSCEAEVNGDYYPGEHCWCGLLDLAE